MDAIRASTLYVQAEDYERGEAVLQAVLKKLDAARDLYVARALHRRIAAIGRRERTRADAEARALLAKAAVLERADEHEQAAATYKIVAGRPAGEVTQALIERAKLGQIRAETTALEEEHSALRRFWNWIKGPLETVAEWVLYAILILAVIGLIWLGRRGIRRIRPANRTALALEDLTAPTSERNEKNRVLTRELMTSIKSFGVGGADSSSAEIDETPDLDGTLLVNLKVVGTGLEAFESTIHDETPLKVGFVSFSPRQLLSLGALYFRRRSKQELTGSLATVGTRALLAVDLAGGDPKKPSRWAVVAKGADARSDVLEDMATRIVLDFGGSQVSTNWQSFRSYRSAMSALDEAAKNFAKREESLQAARQAFQRALDHDPANLLARFNLSNVLRKLGDNEAAVEHYAFLERVVESSDPERNAAAGLLLEKHADFLYVVRYNRACALAKIDDWECHNNAIELLQELIVDAATLPKPEDRSRLQLLVRATWSSALVFELEQSRHDQRSERRNAIVRQIEDVRDFVEQLPAEEVPEWTTYVTARATVQNALGRAYYLVGKYDQANEAFERALSMTADFGDARVNLASLLIREKGRYPRWVTRAEDHLKRALELSPHDRKARYLLGLLYQEPAVNRLKEAKEEFAKVDDSRSLSQLAQINEREGDLASAIAFMRRSIYRSPELDYRTELYLKWLLRLHGQTSQNRETLEDGVVLGERLVKATKERKREAATELLDRLKQALAELGE